MRTEFDEGAGPVVEGKVVEGTVVEGTVVDGTTVVDGNIVLDGEMLGAGPTALLPPLALPSAGVEPTLLSNELGGVPVMLGAGVALYGEVVIAPGVVVIAPGVVAAAPGAAGPAPAAPTWAPAGKAASIERNRNGARSRSSMGKASFSASLSKDNHASFVPTASRDSTPSP